MSTPESVEPVGDVGDHIDPTAPDPKPDEITDPAHPDHVDPYPDATPVDDQEVTA
ncbi:hypothetical protein [Actinokineospora sp.]|uniref:hypothetical protein n=1 Tax=Actinokineospora sp. TaxID=1872133 RepID=UPI003D6C2D85